jgi:hypothetical protein
VVRVKVSHARSLGIQKAGCWLPVYEELPPIWPLLLLVLLLSPYLRASILGP